MRTLARLILFADALALLWLAANALRGKRTEAGMGIAALLALNALLLSEGKRKGAILPVWTE